MIVLAIDQAHLTTRAIQCSGKQIRTKYSAFTWLVQLLSSPKSEEFSGTSPAAAGSFHIQTLFAEHISQCRY
jgi:hypothetical protein